jgi:hypothetical protein
MDEICLLLRRVENCDEEMTEEYFCNMGNSNYMLFHVSWDRVVQIYSPLSMARDQCPWWTIRSLAGSETFLRLLSVYWDLKSVRL